jgi:hypothetical protein
MSTAAPAAWIAFAGNGNIRFWTADPVRAAAEKERGLDLRMFTLAELVALAAHCPVSRAVNSIPDRVYWLIGSGRTKPTEPLYAIQLIDPESGVAIIETEGEDLAATISDAVEQLARVQP